MIAGMKITEPGRSSRRICALIEGLVSDDILASGMRMKARTVMVIAPIGRLR